MERSEMAFSPEFDCNNEATEDKMQLPPGFRFHPTDEELITHYLSQKVLDARFNAQAIGEVDLNKCEPWELPRLANLREDELYFFCVRDRKYPTGLRTNRATGAGYWKATGKDKEIYRMKQLVGMKKTLVFYRGRAPRGEKTNWVMHEYRVEGKCTINGLPRFAKNDWVLCRIFKKSSVGSGKKPFGMVKMGSSSCEEEMEAAAPPPTLSPLMEYQAHVTCFSNSTEGQKAHDPDLCTSSADMSSIFSSKFMPVSTSLYGGSFMSLLDGDSFQAKQDCRKEREILSISQETGLTSDMNPEISSGNKIGMNSFMQGLWNC